MSCSCYCHVNQGASCTVDAGHGVGCGPHEQIPDSCQHCGQSDGTHPWVEGDCVLPHGRHSRKLVSGTFVCRPCVDRHEDWLNEIVELYATLPEVLFTDDMPAGDGEYQKPRKRPASPSPLRLQAWALLHPETLRTHVHTDDTRLRRDGSDLEQAWLGGSIPDVADVLRNWAQAVSDAKGWTTVAPATVSGAAAALRIGAETVASLPDVDEYDAELKWIRRHLQQAHSVSDPKPLFKCISVGCKGRVWQQEKGEPKCDRCSRRYGTLDYVRAKRMQETEGQAAS